MMRWLRRLLDVRGQDVAAWPVHSPETAAKSKRLLTKPRVRIRPDGWIRHAPGPFPFDPKTMVETVMADGLALTGQYAEYAGFWHESWWLGRADSWKRNIRFYRIVAHPEVRP